MPSTRVMNEPLLTVEKLCVAFPASGGPSQVVRDVDLRVGREKVGIVGESGAGKSTAGRAILKLLPPKAKVSAARLQFETTDIMAATERQMQQIRGGRIAMILQDPKFSLNPLIPVGRQIAEAYRIHRSGSKGEARREALAMLEAVHIRDPERVFRLYPHEVSGGMGQRIMIAMMLISGPALIIADEPTSALDVTVRRQVLAILDELVTARGAGLIFISHDLNLVAEFCDRVLVMYAGRIMEELLASHLDQARHPYTRALLDSLPRLERPVDELIVPTRDPAWLDGPVAYGNP
jgi:peptide/nickel transport system ATP-binding protein